MIVDTATVAKYLGVARRTVTHYGSAKGMPKVGQDKWDLVAVRQWELRQVRVELEARQYDQNRLTKAAADEKEEKALASKARRLHLEGLLIDRKEVERVWIEKIVAVKSGLDMLARRIAERIDVAGAEAIVQEEVDLCCDRFAGKKEKK